MDLSNAIIPVVAKALPGLSSEKFTYNAEKNIFLSMGFTSAMGNTYFKVLRMSGKIAVLYAIGIGYCRTFLNNISIFALAGNGQAILIGQKQWGGSNCCYYDETFANNKCIEMVSDFLMGEAKRLGNNATRKDADMFASALIRETQKKLLN